MSVYKYIHIVHMLSPSLYQYLTLNRTSEFSRIYLHMLNRYQLPGVLVYLGPRDREAGGFALHFTATCGHKDRFLRGDRQFYNEMTDSCKYNSLIRQMRWTSYFLWVYIKVHITSPSTFLKHQCCNTVETVTRPSTSEA